MARFDKFTLKPALARGELRCVGATTLNEYRKYIEKDPASRERLAKIEKELAGLSEKRSGQRAQWQAEKGCIQKIRTIKEQIEQARIDADKAERAGNLGRAAELRYGKLLELRKQLDDESAKLSVVQSQIKILKEECGRRGRGGDRVQVDRGSGD